MTTAKCHVRHRTPGLSKTGRDWERNHDQGEAACCGCVFGTLAGRPGYNPGEHGGNDGFDLRVRFVSGWMVGTDRAASFYGFPSHYYKEQYPNVGSAEIAGKVLDSLAEAGIKGEGVHRGLDHGVWASFKCGMFPGMKAMVVADHVSIRTRF